jgi:hypothetical protein
MWTGTAHSQEAVSRKVVFYYSSAEFESAFTVYWSRMEVLFFLGGGGGGLFA